MQWVAGTSLGCPGKLSQGTPTTDKAMLEPRCLTGFMILLAHTLSDDSVNKIFTSQFNTFLRVCSIKKIIII